MRYVLKQDFFSFGNSFTIQDEQRRVSRYGVNDAVDVCLSMLAPLR